MSKVFVIDQNKKPLNPVHPGRARTLLSSGQAAVYRRYPFTIILKQVIEQPLVQSLRVKLDPGSKTTGIAVVNDTTGDVVFAAELQHRGNAIKSSLVDRRASRRSRRNRHTRYRAARFNNRTKPKGWLAPSLMSRVYNVETWVKRLQRLCPIDAISVELVRFDLQRMENPEISGFEYQQGTLQGYEVREYVLEKWNRQCVYCGKKDVPLEIEHIHPRAKGGTNRISNLTLACEPCNRAKGIKDVKEFLAKKPDILKRVLSQAKAPLKDAAAVNSTRWTLYERLQTIGLPIECGSGGMTKYNRITRELEKTHWLDAACVGKSTPEHLQIAGVRPLLIKAMGHGTRQMCQTDKYGFPKQHRQRHKHYFGFQTGDIARIIIPKGKYAGRYTGRITVRASGSFKCRVDGKDIACNHRYCTPLHRNDGYQYQLY